jgi:hypothetical protein
MTDDLHRLAAQHQRAFNYPPVEQTIQFLNACADAIHCRTQMAKDGLPIGIKATKGDTMPRFRRRPARDQMFARGRGEPDVSLADLTRDEEGGFGSRLGEGLKRAGEGINRFSETTERNTSTDEDDENGDIDAGTLLHLVQLCRNGLLSRDQENGGSEADEFLAGLADLLQNGNGVNGDSRRRRSARDQLPSGSNSARSPMNGIGSYPGGSDRRRTAHDGRRPAQDAALVDRINRSGFQHRWGALTGHIKFGANGR